MKKTLVIALTGILLIATAAVSSATTLDVGVKAGYATLTGDKNDAFDGALSGGLYVQYDYSPKFAIQGSWLWHKHDASEEANAVTNFLASEAIGLPALTDVRLTINEFDVNGKFTYTMPTVSPYLIAGFGLYYWKVDGKEIVGEFDRKSDETFWDFGINFGGGVSYDVNDKISVGGEIIYTYVFDEYSDGFFNFLLNASYGFSLGSW